MRRFYLHFLATFFGGLKPGLPWETTGYDSISGRTREGMAQTIAHLQASSPTASRFTVIPNLT